VTWAVTDFLAAATYDGELFLDTTEADADLEQLLACMDGAVTSTATA
jgi:hypothetical protein